MTTESLPDLVRRIRAVLDQAAAVQHRLHQEAEEDARGEVVPPAVNLNAMIWPGDELLFEERVCTSAELVAVLDAACPVSLTEADPPPLVVAMPGEMAAAYVQLFRAAEALAACEGPDAWVKFDAALQDVRKAGAKTVRQL